ncbi:methyltransferase-like protein 27 [Tiliqua scincoides]|uniref:methyltransferase-like protein 27 n=1 Tax=Tiliqua scincoides TaxID=71010 RepID=UPI00346210FC
MREEERSAARAGRAAGRLPCAPRAEPEQRGRRMAEAQRRVARVHREADLARQLRRYDGWAPDYEQDVAALQYQAPRLAAACLASVFQGPPEDALVLDVACGTGLLAQELQAQGFCHFHGLDGSPGMLEHACRKGLYQDLKECILGQGALPAPTGCYDAVLIVGALSGGQVPITVVPELLRVTKPGGYVCLTTRSNQSNLLYKAQLEQLLVDLEQQGLWEKVLVQEVEQWEKSTSEQETSQGPGYISGVVYLYRKKLRPGE